MAVQTNLQDSFSFLRFFLNYSNVIKSLNTKQTKFEKHCDEYNIGIILIYFLFVQNSIKMIHKKK